MLTEDDNANLKLLTKYLLTKITRLNMHLEIIMAPSLKFKGNNLNITTLLNELKAAMIPSSVSFTALRQILPNNQVLENYLLLTIKSIELKEQELKAQKVFKQNLEILKYNIKADLEFLQEIITLLNGNHEFSFLLAQKLLHDIYLEAPLKERNSPVIEYLSSWVLSIRNDNPGFILDKSLDSLMHGHIGFKQEITLLMHIRNRIGS